MNKKDLFNHLRFIYKVGLLKSLFILFAFLSAEAEYKIRWKRHDVFLRKGTTDFVVFRQVLVFEHYEIKGFPDVNTIIDLGANIGLSTLYYKLKFPNARIVSVEPEPGNFEMLKRNVAGLEDVYCLRKAIWNLNKNLLLKSSKYGEYGFRVEEVSNARGDNVQSVTIDDLISQYKFSTVNLLKIDIEGSELELFSENYSGWLNYVDCIVIELHDWFKPGCASSFFRAISQRPFNMSGRGENITISFVPERSLISQVTIGQS